MRDVGALQSAQQYRGRCNCSSSSNAGAQAERGNGVILSGEFGGARVAYVGTDCDLGVIVEIFSGTPDDRPQPYETDP